MIDICPPWLAPQFPLHQLEHGTGPYFRTTPSFVGNYRWVCVTNHSGQQICEVKQTFLSVTRLVEQGFQLTLDDNRIKGFNSTLENRNGMFFLQAAITAVPKGTRLQTNSAEQGQMCMIAPTATLTPQGPADTGDAGEYSAHWQYRKTLFTLRCFGALQLLEKKVPCMVLQLPALRLVVSCVGVAGSVLDLSQVCQEWQAWTDSLSPKVPECNEGSSWSQGCVLEASFGMLSKILSPENP